MSVRMGVPCWRSLVKAAHTVRYHALYLASVLPHTDLLCAAIALIHRCLAAGCRLNTRKTYPTTYQLLLEPALLALA